MEKKKVGFMELLFLTLSVVLWMAYKGYQSRKNILKECESCELEIVNSYIKDNDKTYWNHYGQGSRQKVLAREDNVLVVNFKNFDKEMAKKLKRIS